MSCITIIGRARVWNQACDIPLPRHSPPWTATKQRRLDNMQNASDPKIRAIAASHPRTADLDLMHALFDVDAGVRRAAVKNPNMTPNHWMIALGSDDPGIVAYARLITGGQNA